MINRRQGLLGGAAFAAGLTSASAQVPLSPGVYIEEVPSGLRLKVGALETSQTLMVTAHLNSKEPVLITKPGEVAGVAKPAGLDELQQNVDLFFGHGGRSLHLFPVLEDQGQGLLAHELTHITLQSLADMGQLFGGDWKGSQRPLPIGLILVPEVAKLADAQPDEAAELYREATRTAEALGALAIIDTPARIDGMAFGANNAVTDARDWRARLAINSSHAALYGHQLTDRDGQPVPISPAIAGLITRVDGNRGVWKAPAGTYATLRRRPAQRYTTADMQVLNPEGINTVREVGGRAPVVWGSRTLAPSGSETLYIPTRRTLDHITHSVRWSLQAVVFEPNDEPLWEASRRAIENFLTRLWRQGALQGTRPEQAFFVRCGLGETMTEDDIDNGRMIVNVGFAPLQPAEFIVQNIEFEGFTS